MCLVEHAEIARAMVREAYRAGAKHVVVVYGDLHVRRAGIELGPEEEIGWSPPYVLDWVRRWKSENPAVISLTGNPEPDLLADLDPALVGRADPRDLRVALLESIQERSVNWVIVAAPNEGWATQVFGEPDVERLWGAVATATRLDEPDPVAAWQAHAARLAERADAMNSHAFDAVRFQGPGTDLTLGLVPKGVWRCASFSTAKGIEHIPNLPTEEVFTSPDWRRAEGVVRSTYPLVTAGTRVSGLEARFEDGKIVEVNADSGAEIIRQQLAMDEQAPYLGELALVDGSSPVKQAGPRLLRHALRRERDLPHRLRIGLSRDPPGGSAARGASRARDQRLRGPRRLHDRRPGRRRRRPRRRRKRDADHPRRRLAAHLRVVTSPVFMRPAQVCASVAAHWGLTDAKMMS